MCCLSGWHALRLEPAAHASIRQATAALQQLAYRCGGQLCSPSAMIVHTSQVMLDHAADLHAWLSHCWPSLGLAGAMLDTGCALAQPINTHHNHGCMHRSCGDLLTTPTSSAACHRASTTSTPQPTLHACAMKWAPTAWTKPGATNTAQNNQMYDLCPHNSSEARTS